MKVHNPSFVISAVGPDQYPSDGLPEVALAGRSNVGKSSFINRLIDRKNLARTSSQPGKTQMLNYYRIDDKFYFVDLPGYGFAKVSKKMRQQWGQMIEQYLLHREELKLVALLVDLRHAPTADDQMMAEWLKHYEIPFIVVATKADKISKSKRIKHLKEAASALQLGDEHVLIPFSSVDGQGKEEAWQAIEKFI